MLAYHTVEYTITKIYKKICRHFPVYSRRLCNIIIFQIIILNMLRYVLY